MSEAKTPLSLYVLWHPDFAQGADDAEQVYSNFSRDVDKPLGSRRLGIPVVFRSSNAFANPIKYSEAERTAIVALVDANMVADEDWQEYIGRITEDVKQESGAILYLFAYEKCSLNLVHTGGNNACRLYEEKTKEQVTARLVHVLAHELCRMLYNRQRLASTRISPAPLTLFLSHAKADGEEIAKKISRHVSSDIFLRDFFDARDIAIGYRFPEELEANVENSALLIIHSDAYASREWCRNEVLLAKRHNRPIVVLNALNVGEDRSFPYMSNVQTLRISRSLNPGERQRILTCILIETLRLKYQELFVRYIAHRLGTDLDTAGILSYPPELLTILDLDRSKNLFIYPEPPLSDEEIALLHKSNSEAEFITPSMIPAIHHVNGLEKRTKVLGGMTVGISISENPECQKLGMRFVHLQDAMIEIARYLLVCGANLAYGGDIHYRHRFNFVETLRELVRAHNKDHAKAKQRIENFVPRHIKVDTHLIADLRQEIKFVISTPLDQNAAQHHPRVMEADNLTEMREKMNNAVGARVILGGKLTGFKGKYPGIVEEAYLAMKRNTPVFLMGAFGGAAKAVIDSLRGELPQELKLDFHLAQPEYREFFKLYASEYPAGHERAVDYQRIADLFSTKSVVGLNNGLSYEENCILFETTNIMEAIALIVKGLSVCPNP